MKRAYNFEVYTKHPITGAPGWDIKFISVFACNKKEAISLLSHMPCFDCIILYNHCAPMNHDEVRAYAMDADWHETAYPYQG